MKRFIYILGLVLFFAAGALFAQQPPEIRYHSVPNFLKLPPGHLFGRSGGRGSQFERTRLCLFARQ